MFVASFVGTKFGSYKAESRERLSADDVRHAVASSLCEIALAYGKRSRRAERDVTARW